MKKSIAGIFCFLAGILSVNLFATSDVYANANPSPCTGDATNNFNGNPHYCATSQEECDALPAEPGWWYYSWTVGTYGYFKGKGLCARVVSLWNTEGGDAPDPELCPHGDNSLVCTGDDEAAFDLVPPPSCWQGIPPVEGPCPPVVVDDDPTLTYEDIPPATGDRLTRTPKDVQSGPEAVQEAAAQLGIAATFVPVVLNSDPVCPEGYNWGYEWGYGRCSPDIPLLAKIAKPRDEIPEGLLGTTDPEECVGTYGNRREGYRTYYWDADQSCRTRVVIGTSWEEDPPVRECAEDEWEFLPGDCRSCAPDRNGHSDPACYKSKSDCLKDKDRDGNNLNVWGLFGDEGCFPRPAVLWHPPQVVDLVFPNRNCDFLTHRDVRTGEPCGDIEFIEVCQPGSGQITVVYDYSHECECPEGQTYDRPNVKCVSIEPEQSVVPNKLTRTPEDVQSGPEAVQEAAAQLGIAQASYAPVPQISPSDESRLPEYAAPAAILGALAFSSLYPDYDLNSSFDYSGENGSLDWEAGMRGDFHHGSFSSFVSAVQSDRGFTIHSGTTYRSDSFLASYTTVEAKDYMNYNVQLSAPWQHRGWNISPNLSSEFHYDRDENHSSSESGAGLDLEYRF